VGTFYAKAQYISGVLIDNTNHPLLGANITLLTVDSVFLTGGVTDESGNFKIENSKKGKLIFKITYVGYTTLFLSKVVSDNPLNLGKIVLMEVSSEIKEVTVTGIMPTAQIKGDTTIYNAGAYKTNPDATAENLIEKMPGITSENGKLKVQGEDVKQVLVDGKPFFGDDPNTVLKNIPADVIDKIQVFDRKSDQSQQTGFDDGNTSKTINIITKTQFRNGTFGKVYAGYGYEDKYRGGFNVNYFKNKRRISFIGNSNNINEQNFSAEDLVGVMSSSSGNSSRGQGQGSNSQSVGRRGGGSGGDANNFLVDQKNGISKTNALGINYSNSWKKVDFTGSYFLNYSINDALSALNRQYVTSETVGLIYYEKDTTKNINTNHRINAKLDWKIDSNNSLNFRPKISFQNNDGKSRKIGINSSLGNDLSKIINIYETVLDGSNISAPVFYRHGFKKKGRTFSTILTPGYNSNSGNSSLNYFASYTDTLSSDIVSQNANLSKTGYVFSSNVSFTEPLSKKSQALFTYNTNYNKSDSRKKTINNQYQEMDTTLSNSFITKYYSHSVGASYRYQIDKYNFTGGLTFQVAHLNNQQTFPVAYTLSKPFFSVLPSINFQYKFTTQRNLRINYYSSNNAPSADQLQEVINNKNPFALTTGNSNLKQDWQNNINMRYSSVNTKKATAFFLFLGGNLTQNNIVNSTFITPIDTLIAPNVLLARGSQISKPVNLNGFNNLRMFSNYSFPYKKVKINLNLSAMNSHTPAMINGKTNFANNSTLGFGASIASNISPKIDFTLSSSTNYNMVTNTLQTDLNSTYFNQNTKFKIQANVWKGLVIQTDLSHQLNSGLSANFNQNYLLWNAAIAYKFFKDQRADLRLSIYDIMMQNNSIARNVTETYYEDVQTNVLQRYVMLTFAYNLKFFKETKKTDVKPGIKK